MRRLASHCQALAAPPPSATAVGADSSQGPRATVGDRADAARGSTGSKGLAASAAHRADAWRGADGCEGSGVATAQLLARRCLAEAAALAAALGARYDAGALGVLLLHLTSVRRCAT